MHIKLVIAMIITLWTTAAGAKAPISAQKVTDAASFDLGNKVDSDVLNLARGSADLSMVIAAKNSSDVSNNSVSGTSVTGGINFDQAALSNLSGLSVLSANTGNNVAINSSLNLNVAIHP